MGDMFRAWNKRNYVPKHQDHQINLVLQELEDKKHRKVKGHFDIEEYETNEERVEDLKRICG
jgi:hypothetical protein